MSKKSSLRSSNGRFKRTTFLIFEHPSLQIEASTNNEKPYRNYRDGESATVKSESANLRLVTKEISNKIKKTTTPMTDLIWPTKVKVSLMQKQSILEMAGGVDSEVIQNLLDEMQNTTKVVRNPVAYFHDLLTKHKSGTYTRSGAIAEAEKRESKKKTEERMESMRQESIRRGDEFMAKYSKASPD